MEPAAHAGLAGPMSTPGRHVSRAARTRSARELEAAQARARMWLGTTAACVLLALASPLVLPPLLIAFAALSALAASRWRHYHRAASALTRRHPRTPATPHTDQPRSRTATTSTATPGTAETTETTSAEPGNHPATDGDRHPH